MKGDCRHHTYGLHNALTPTRCLVRKMRKEGPKPKLRPTPGVPRRVQSEEHQVPQRWGHGLNLKLQNLVKLRRCSESPLNPSQTTESPRAAAVATEFQANSKGLRPVCVHQNANTLNALLLVASCFVAMYFNHVCTVQTTSIHKYAHTHTRTYVHTYMHTYVRVSYT